MNANWILSIYRIVIPLVAVMAFVNCSGSNGHDEKHQIVDLNNRYRSLIQEQFQTKSRHFNADTRYLIIVDYSIPSNSNRLFVWDTEQDEIVEKFWCAHGFGGSSTADKPEFSNAMGSNCSSLGWFLVDKSVGVSATYGYRYHAVDGLDTCNSNARSRQLLIHPWSSVTRDYQAKIQHPMVLDYRSAGCFTTTDEGFKTIDRYIKSCQKRLLLYAIN